MFSLATGASPPTYGPVTAWLGTVCIYVLEMPAGVGCENVVNYATLGDSATGVVDVLRCIRSLRASTSDVMGDKGAVGVQDEPAPAPHHDVVLEQARFKSSEDRPVNGCDCVGSCESLGRGAPGVLACRDATPTTSHTVRSALQVLPY